MPSCPCGSNLEFDACCAPYLEGNLAPTAEALMRSRYTAHVMGNIDYLERTYTPEDRGNDYRTKAKHTIEETKWLGLEILNTKSGGPDDQTGQVEYAYRYTQKGHIFLQQEIGNFVRKNKAWLYKDSIVNPKSGALPVYKQGRNEICSCGSGKKYKKCCGA